MILVVLQEIGPMTRKMGLASTFMQMVTPMRGNGVIIQNTALEPTSLLNLDPSLSAYGRTEKERVTAKSYTKTTNLLAGSRMTRYTVNSLINSWLNNLGQD